MAWACPAADQKPEETGAAEDAERSSIQLHHHLLQSALGSIETHGNPSEKRTRAIASINGHPKAVNDGNRPAIAF